jgi:hypothetical protein
MIFLILKIKAKIINFIKYFSNVRQALYEYMKNIIDVHSYIWIYINKPTKTKRLIKIRKKKKKIKKLSFIF